MSLYSSSVTVLSLMTLLINSKTEFILAAVRTMIILFLVIFASILFLALVDKLVKVM